MSGMKRTVLLVEDEPDVRLAARMMLEAAGYAVIEASGGEEALEQVERTKVDAVLLDLRMPDVDGWSVLENLQAQRRTSRLPVIVVSAASVAEISVERGAVGFVRKPFRAAELTRALEAVLA